MSEPDIYYLVQLRASAIEQKKKDGYTWMSPEHVIRLLDAFEEQRARNAELVAAMARALDLIKTQAQHRADHGSQSEPLPWISEAYRVIDAALAAAGKPQGSGK